MNILQINMHDIEGGAAVVAWNLFKGYQARGYGSWLAVGEKTSTDPGILEIPRRHPPYLVWAKLSWGVYIKLKKYEGRTRGIFRIRRWLYSISDVWAEIERQLGREDFNFRGSWRLREISPDLPDIINAHNLHENFFDLRSLPSLSRQVPVVLTLHDAWLLSGHCSHSFDCERWKTGCGACPDLNIPPAVMRDATAYNWEQKRYIFSQCRVFVITPSKWLMEKTKQSILAPAIIDSRVIPNGIDLKIFHPNKQKTARAALGLPMNARILVFVASDITKNRFKDFETIRKAVLLVSRQFGNQEIKFVALGETAPIKTADELPVEFVGFNPDPTQVALYYQAADIYVHSALEETFPNTILEAMACGTPVVATGVGGIPEQVQDGMTGFLVPRLNPEELAEKITILLKDENMRQRMGKKAAEIASQHFALNYQLDQTMDFYEDVLSKWKAESGK